MKHHPETEKSVKPSAGRQPAAESIMNGNVSGKSLSPPIQKKPNETGLPDQLKDGVESLSGYSMDDVNVHYNSSKPAQLNAHAYAQGTDIHVGPGQEKHLPHEAWHVVQQKQGRVKPTRQLKEMVNINDDAGLEKEADEMGTKAFQLVDNITEAAAQRVLQEKANKSPQLKQSRAINELVNGDAIDGISTQKLGAAAIQRKIDYGNQETNSMAEMSVPSGTSLYHATKREHIPKIGEGIDVTASKSTQLGKGFYTSWFSAGMEEYGAYVVRFKLNRDILGQQVFSDKIQEGNNEEATHFKADKIDESKAVKGNWDIENDFLYTPKLDEKVDGQNVPHQVKITAQGVGALSNATVIETGTGKESPISEYKTEPIASRPALGGLFADIKSRNKK